MRFGLNPVFTTLYFPIMIILFCNDLYCFSRRVFGKREERIVPGRPFYRPPV